MFSKQFDIVNTFYVLCIHSSQLLSEIHCFDAVKFKLFCFNVELIPSHGNSRNQCKRGIALFCCGFEWVSRFVTLSANDNN